MRNSKKLIKILAIVCSIIFIQSYSNAEVIKFSNCKYIKAPIAELVHKIMKGQNSETLPYNEKEGIKELNDPFEFINRTFDTETKILTYEGKKKGEDLSVNKSNFKIKKTEIITIDGIRVEFKNGWGLLRASNTSAILVLRFEADSKNALNEISDIFKKELGKIDKKLMNF